MMQASENHGENAFRILFLSANPKDSDRIRVDEEAREIREKLQSAKMRENFEIHPLTAVRPEDLCPALLDIKPRIVHFSGHSTAEGEVYLENEFGLCHPVGSDAMASLFELFSDRVECVVLNACYSKKQAEAIVEHVPYVIGMTRQIHDKAAIAFSVGFYQALGAGEPIELAYKLGVVQIKLKGISESLIPVLLKKSDYKSRREEEQKERNLEEVRDTSGKPEAMAHDTTHFNPFVISAPVDEKGFYGRRGELAELQEHIKRKENVILIGEHRMGKTSLLKRLCQYLEPPVLSVYVDLREFPGQAGELLNGILRQVMTALSEHGLLSSDRRKKFSSIYANEFIDALKSIIDEAGKKRKGIKIVLLLDEAEILFTSGRPIWGVLRAALRKESDVVTIIAGSNRLLKMPEAADAATPFNAFSILRIPPLSKEETTLMISGHFEWAGAICEPEALERIYKLSGGIPLYVGSIGFELIELAHRKLRSKIVAEDVEEILTGLINRISKTLQYIFHQLDEQEKAILYAILKNESLNKYNKKSIRDLEKKQMIEKVNDHYRFVAHLFEEWYKQNVFG